MLLNRVDTPISLLRIHNSDKLARTRRRKVLQMAGPAGGPSRRSHTKSRNGCKTCKRRHIRCDESMPQCRNCTKHHVKCDYMDVLPATNISQRPESPKLPNLLWTPGIEAAIDAWQQSGSFPFHSLHVWPAPEPSLYSKIDLRLIHHLCQMSADMIRSGASKMTIWCDKIPQFLSMASKHRFVMNALLGLSASHLAWLTQSSETRQLALQYDGVALSGLHEAIGSFSKENSDPVLACSLLLSWQATEWRSWTSLMTGLKTVTSAMQPWGNESLLLDFVVREMDVFSDETKCSAENSEDIKMRSEHVTKLQRLHGLLEHVNSNLTSDDQDSKLLEKLISYVQRLRSFNIAQSAEDQFTRLYALRKWLFWVPADLLQARRNDPSALLVLAYFFTTMLELEPIFPKIGAAFGADLALTPLEEIITALKSMIPARPSLPFWQMVLALMKFPQKVAADYRNQKIWTKQRHSKETYASHGSVFHPEQIHLDVVQQLNDYRFHDGREAFRDSPLSQFGGDIPDVGSSLTGPSIPTSDQSDYTIHSGRTSVIGGRDLETRASCTYGSPVDRLVMMNPETQRSDYAYNMGFSYPYSSGPSEWSNCSFKGKWPNNGRYDTGGEYGGGHNINLRSRGPHYSI